MSVRHVHARRGEYIKVHRNYGGGGCGGDSGCAIVLGWCVLIGVGVFVIMWIIEHLVIILTILLGLAVTAGIIWALYTFREQIWKLLCKAGNGLAKLLCRLIDKCKTKKLDNK